MKQSIKTHKNEKEDSKELKENSVFYDPIQNNDTPKFKFGTFGNAKKHNLLPFMIEPIEFSDLPPNLIVIFKNISKKDTTTKLKALDDISTWIDENPGKLNESNFLNIWSYLYPRLTINADRQVRLSCHYVHYKIYNESGKRIVKFIKDIIGSWVASTFDNDHGVKKVAIEIFNTVFKTPEKRLAVKKIYHKYILNFNRNVVLKETPTTISDLRYISREASEIRYSKIIASILASIADIILNLDLDELKKEETLYVEIISSEKFWKFLYETDLTVKKYFYEIIKNISNKWPELLISQKNMIKKSVTNLMKNTENPSTSVTFQIMEVFFSVCPDIWEHDFFGDPLLFSYFKKLILSNNSNSEQFWNDFYDLIIKIPLNPYKSDFEVYLNDFLDMIWEGASKKTRYNNVFGLETFFKIICFYEKQFENINIIFSILEKRISNIFNQYFINFASLNIKVSEESFRCALIKGFLINEYISDDLFDKFWYDSKQYILEKLPLKISNNLHEENCDGLSTIGIRWINTADEFIKKINKNSKNNKLSKKINVIFPIINEITYSIIFTIKQHNDLCHETVNLLSYVLSKFTNIIFKNYEIISELEILIMEKISKFITPLRESIGSILSTYIVENKITENLGLVWTSIFSCLSKIENKLDRNDFVHKIVQMIIDTKVNIKDLKGHLPRIDLIDHVLLDCVHSSIENISENWESLNNFFTVKEIIFSEDVLIESLLCFTEKILFPEDPEFYDNMDNNNKILILLYKILSESFDLYLYFLQNPRAIEFHIKIWNFTQIKKENISENIIIFNNLFKQIYCLDNKTGNELRLDIANIIQKQVLSLDFLDFSLIRSFHILSIEILFYATEFEKKKLLDIFLFTSYEWEMAFSPLILNYPDKNLELFNSLKTCCLVFSNSAKTKKNIEIDNISTLLKMTVFSEMIINSLILNSYFLEIHWLILYGIMICGELIRDNFELEQANCLWKSITEEHESELFALIERSKDFFFNIINSDNIKIIGIDDSIQRNHMRFLKKLEEYSIGKSPKVYYSACILFRTLQILMEKEAYSQEEAETWLNDIPIENEQNIFIFAAIFNGFREKLIFSKRLENIKNRICSDLSGKFMLDKDLKKIILFNIFIPFEDNSWKHLPQQRIIFLFQNLLESVNEKNTISIEHINFYAEIIKIFIKLIPFIKTICGMHWNNIFNYLCQCLKMCNTQLLDFLNFEFYSIKLFTTLNLYYTSNEDFNDAWDINQPLQLCIQLLSKILVQIPLTVVEKPLINSLYSHLSSQWKYTQIVTFDWLTNWISKNQEDLIVDTEFSKVNVNLPSELLSIISNSSYYYDLLDYIDYKKDIFYELRCYFLSWILIFTHFKNSSFILKSCYIENLKNINCISFAIELIFKTLKSLNNRSINSIEISRDINQWKNIDNTKIEMQSLSAYTYLFILKYVPSLARNWWINCKNRQLTQLVEMITEKYISPILIEEEIDLVLLESVQLKMNDNNIHVKTSKTTREVTTTYTIDDQYLEMVIRLPPCYPLCQVSVEGVQKIGIKDSQWRAWLLASKILITTQNGSIVDAVSLFKRNVSLHFEGVAEFSIISVQDRSLPTKKCTTCKNKFHSSCLYKWFKTSNTSRCPLCRTAFSFTS
ncbi:hypothetical protein PCANB_002164 [Pneumocystis canis]|nr:hypothetical protein PCANB_002164 [Pneumocystis canis]